MATLIGRDSSRETLGFISQSYLEYWMEHGINKKANPPHTNLQYDRPETHGKLQNNKETNKPLLILYRSSLQPLRRRSPEAEFCPQGSVRHAK
jgi:hypothetical protein